MKGKWVGSWKMSSGMEKLLRRMISPNADMRCTATEAMADPYWSHHTRTQSDAGVVVPPVSAYREYMRLRIVECARLMLIWV